VAARLQAARNALRYPARNVLTAREAPQPSRKEEMNDELSQADALTLDVVRWLRRLLIPLATLAWAGVVILILNAAGYLKSTLLLLGIAILLAYALSPLVTFFARAVPRFLAILIAIWYEWHETHKEEFQAVKEKVNEQVENNIADKPAGLESETKLLS
jgi:hypothetical protein